MVVEETLVRRYVDIIFEATGLLRKGRLNPKGLEKLGGWTIKRWEPLLTAYGNL